MAKSSKRNEQLFKEWSELEPLAQKIAQSAWVKYIIRHDKVDGRSIPDISKNIIFKLKEDYVNPGQVMELLGLSPDYAYALKEFAQANALEMESYLSVVVCLALFIASREEGMRQLKVQNKTINTKGVSHSIMDRCIGSYLTIALSVIVSEICLNFVKRGKMFPLEHISICYSFHIHVAFVNAALKTIANVCGISNTEAALGFGLHKTR